MGQSQDLLGGLIHEQPPISQSLSTATCAHLAQSAGTQGCEGEGHLAALIPQVSKVFRGKFRLTQQEKLHDTAVGALDFLSIRTRGSPFWPDWAGGQGGYQAKGRAVLTEKADTSPAWHT
jgi:hypothetical protein